MDLQVFIFTWNTQTVRYGPKADFIDALADKIIGGGYDLAVIGLQEDAIRGSPLLTDIEESLAGEYELLQSVLLSGWGVTTYKAMKDRWEYLPRGLRLAVFRRGDLALEITKIDSAEMVCPGIRDWITAGKGGVVINIETAVGKVSFLNVHLPFSSRSIIQDSAEKISYRHDAVMWQAYCLRALYENVVRQCTPDYMFVLGDLNFRVQLRTESGAAEVARRIFSDPDYVCELIKEADELGILIDYSRYIEAAAPSRYELTAPLPVLDEGVNGAGPTFYPTCKLRQGRSELTAASFKLGHRDQRTPSWCDRILSKRLGEGNIDCLVYDRWDYGSMNLSDHASVVGVYQITL